jgi:DNA ligase-associated metallophosphoesterase
MQRKPYSMRPLHRDRVPPVALPLAPVSSFELGGEELVADVSGALWCEKHRALIVSDLHFEKGSSFARRGIFLPPYDTRATLLRLGQVVLRFQPSLIIALGDSFHDVGAPSRLSEEDQSQIARLQEGRDWIWIAGNHDAVFSKDVGGQMMQAFELGPLHLVHEPTLEIRAEIAGHLHPVARVTSPMGSTRRRCFATTGSRCIMPAFGALAGGLNICDAAYADLLSETATLHVLGRNRVYAVPHSRCLPD